MNSRERMVAAIEFRKPDRIPLFYHPSPAGLYVHGEKLLRLFQQIPGDNRQRFDSLPAPSPETLHHGEYHELRRDAWGTVWEYLIFGIQGHPKEYPLTGWLEADDDLLPPLPGIDAAEIRQTREAGFPVFGGEGSIFERLCSLRPFDEVMMDVFMEDAAVLAFMDRLVAYYKKINQQAADAGVEIFCFGDDFGTQQNAIFPPQLFDRVFVPRYRQLWMPLQQAGKKILFHSCGKIESLLPQLFDLNIDVLWPQLSLYGRDKAFLSRCADRHVALLLHPDRQYLIPMGKPAEIRSWVRDMARRYRDGGGIFYVEIEDDAPWENVKTLLESIAEYR